MITVLKKVSSIVFPARDLAGSISAWSEMLGRTPDWKTGDFASFGMAGIDISLSRLPWVDYPLVFWGVDDVEAAHVALVTGGATPMVEISGGTLAELGKAEPSSGNQDPNTGIITMLGARMAVLKAADGTLFAILQDDV